MTFVGQTQLFLQNSHKKQLEKLSYISQKVCDFAYLFSQHTNGSFEELLNLQHAVFYFLQYTKLKVSLTFEIKWNKKL